MATSKSKSKSKAPVKRKPPAESRRYPIQFNVRTTTKTRATIRQLAEQFKIDVAELIDATFRRPDDIRKTVLASLKADLESAFARKAKGASNG